MRVLRDAMIKEKVQEMGEELIKIPDFIPLEFRLPVINFGGKRKEWLIKEGKYKEFCEMDRKWRRKRHRRNIRGEGWEALLDDAYDIQEFIDKYPQFKPCVDTEVLHEEISEIELILSKKK